MKIYNCKKKILYPPKDFISYNFTDGKYKSKIEIDACIANEVEKLWSEGIKTT